MDELPAALTAHWRHWLGASAGDLAHLGDEGEQGRVVVVGSSARTRAGWDGAVHQLAGIADHRDNAVISVPPEAAGTAAEIATGHDLDGLGVLLAGLLGRPDDVVHRAVYRWSTDVTSARALPDAGVWVPADDARVPPWLLPFGGEVLVCLEADHYLAGVGLKQHDEHCREIAVGTEEAARGRGLARRLVAQAGRRVQDEGRIPTYLHDRGNIASARVADAAGFPDRGWTAFG
jgi:GNAT superfamily N-acetyltransferase